MPLLPRSALRAATALASPGGRLGRLSAFIFHRVLPEPDPLRPYEPHAEQFALILSWIGDQFQVLEPVEACERLRSKSLPPRAAIITFDDGYRDNYELAAPLLASRGMKAAFFVATGYLDGGVMFNDRVIEAVRRHAGPTLDATSLGLGPLPIGTTAQRLDAIARLLRVVKYSSAARRSELLESLESECAVAETQSPMMTSAQVAALARMNMTIGGHTHMHPILVGLQDADVLEEIGRGRDVLSNLLGDPPALFAYPNGKPGDDFDVRQTELVRRCGFEAAFTTSPGAARFGTDSMLLQRHTPWARTSTRFTLQALANLAA